MPHVTELVRMMAAKWMLATNNKTEDAKASIPREPTPLDLVPVDPSEITIVDAGASITTKLCPEADTITMANNHRAALRATTITPPE